MGFDLRRENAHLSVKIPDWISLLMLAIRYGWKPAGTKAPADFQGTWAGSYTLSAWQTVGDADSRRLARALERALPDIPEHDATPRARRPGFLERFSGPDGRKRIKAVIAFCHGGGFRIE